MQELQACLLLVLSGVPGCELTLHNVSSKHTGSKISTFEILYTGSDKLDVVNICLPVTATALIIRPLQLSLGFNKKEIIFSLLFLFFKCAL